MRRVYYRAMRILFSCPDVPGHFNPMATLAHTVRRRGHDCIFLCIEDAAAKVRNAGLEPMVYCREAYPPGRQLVLSVGGNVKPEAIGPVAASTIVLPSVPQLEILKRAALCITHAGLNTALESLAHGVPMVAIPVTNDQPGVAARLAYTGTGVVVPFQQLSVNKLKAAVDLVLSDHRYRENAQRLQRAIEETNGLERAADIIDRTLRDAVRE